MPAGRFSESQSPSREGSSESVAPASGSFSVANSEMRLVSSKGRKKFAKTDFGEFELGSYASTEGAEEVDDSLQEYVNSIVRQVFQVGDASDSELAVPEDVSAEQLHAVDELKELLDDIVEMWPSRTQEIRNHSSYSIWFPRLPAKIAYLFQ